MFEKDELIKTAKKSIEKHSMIQSGDGIVVAASGGPDSMCLIDVLLSLSGDMNLSLFIAHYEHGLRPGEDSYETALVSKYARSFNLHFETEKASGLSLTASSLEEKARKLRYDFLERVRVKYGADKIATGHNLNDQAETVLMRLLRGSGMTGLSGIPPVRDGIVIRPLIEIEKKEIINYLELKNIKYATDSSNRNDRFLRNRMRLELMPEMMKYQPEIVKTLGKLADNLRDENSFFEIYTDDWLDKRLDFDESGNCRININQLKDLPIAFTRRIIRSLAKRQSKNLYGMDADHIQSVIDLISSRKPNTSADLPGNLMVRKEYDKLIFSSLIPDPVTFSHEIKGPGRFNIQEIDRTILVEECTCTVRDLHNDKSTALLDKNLLPYPLTVRNIKPGDRFVPLGMSGSKKIKDFFIDLKVPSSVRKRTPVLLQGGRIVWLCGFRIDDRFKVTPKTPNCLKIKIV